MNFALNLAAVSGPSEKVPDCKVGVDFSNDTSKVRWLINVRDLVSETTFTHLATARWLVGGNLTFDAKKQNLSVYNAGVVW